MANCVNFWESQFYQSFDLLVIGGGIVGMNAAIAFQERNPSAKVAVLERGIVPTGASTRNAGFSCIGSMTELLADADENGWDTMCAVLEKRWKGLLALRRRVGDVQMNYRNWGGMEVFLDKESQVFERCIHQLEKLNRSIASVTGNPQTFEVIDHRIQELGLSGVKHMILNKVEGQIHPGKMMYRLCQIAGEKGILTLNGAEVVAIHPDSDRATISLATGQEISSRNVIVATNGFAKELLPQINVQAVRNQVLITEPIPKLKLKGAFHYHEGYVYFRNVGKRVLIGGGRHLFRKTETTAKFGITDEVQQYLEGFLRKHVLMNHDFKIAQRWSGILGVGDSKDPIINEYLPHIRTAVRLGGMGVAIGTLVGEEAARSISL